MKTLDSAYKKQAERMRRDTEKVLEPLKKYILRGYGKPCKDYNPLCPTCRAWEAYKILKLL